MWVVGDGMGDELCEIRWELSSKKSSSSCFFIEETSLRDEFPLASNSSRS